MMKIAEQSIEPKPLSKTKISTSNSSETYVLVHGAWQAPYAWDMVKNELENKGNKVLVVELPGHGSDYTEPATLTMDSYRDKVIEIIQQAGGKVILAGHSMAGMIISGVAEAIPEKIKKLVFVAAYVPEDGQSAYSISLLDKQSLLGASLIQDPEKPLFDVKMDQVTNIFCQDGSEAVKKMIMDHYRPEPAIPFSNPVHVKPENFGSVEKYFISTLQDNGIGLDLQKQMISLAGITHVYEVNTGHSPFLSKPEEVSKILLQIGSID